MGRCRRWPLHEWSCSVTRSFARGSFTFLLEGQFRRELLCWGTAERKELFTQCKCSQNSWRSSSTDWRVRPDVQQQRSRSAHIPVILCRYESKLQTAHIALFGLSGVSRSWLRKEASLLQFPNIYVWHFPFEPRRWNAFPIHLSVALTLKYEEIIQRENGFTTQRVYGEPKSRFWAWPVTLSWGHFLFTGTCRLCF